MSPDISGPAFWKYAIIKHLLKNIMSAVVIIPARYGSTRFPGKPLALLAGKPLIQHVYERASGATCAKDVVVATDSELIYDAVNGFGGMAVMTSSGHPSGTDRLAEALLELERRGYAAEIIVNVQGDEPLIRPEMLDAAVGLMEDPRASIGTLAKRIADVIEITDPNVVKVAFDREGFALYFSRSPIPYHRELFESGGAHVDTAMMQKVTMYKHIGLYAYRRNFLQRFAELRPTWLEETEKLEQLRALEHGFKIKVGETVYETVGVDTPLDLERVERCLSSYS